MRRWVAIAVFLCPLEAGAGAIVAGANSKFPPIESKEVAQQIFLGRFKSLGGHPVTVVNQEGNRSAEEFTAKVMEQTQADFDAARMRLVFTGETRPPLTVYDDQMVKAAVNANPAAVGFVSDSAIDSSVKVLFRY